MNKRSETPGVRAKKLDLRFKPSRRHFLKQLAIGGLLLQIRSPLAADQDPPTLNGWVRIRPTGEIEILNNTSEIGQGTGTALAQVLAEELDVEWTTVRIAMAPLEARYFNPLWKEYATYESGGIRGQFQSLRITGAQARAMLIKAAAAKWKVSPTECRTDRGWVFHPSSGRRFTYGSLASAATRLPAPSNPALRARKDWRLIGAQVHRLDLPTKVDGSAVFGMDVQLPGLLTAAIRQSPRFGGRLSTVDPKPALQVPGVRQVVPLADAVAVVAGDYWTATRGLANLRPVWDDTAASSATSDVYMRALREAARAGGEIYAADALAAQELMARHAAAMRRAHSSMDAMYTVPFLAHATMEPMNATAAVSASQATLWIPTQSQSAAASAVAKSLGLPASAVTIHTTLSGGGFGRRAEFDFPVQAALIARAMGAPVKLIWSREEDMQHDFYRPAAAIHLGAGIDRNGWPMALRFDSACESLFYYSYGGERSQALPVDRSAVGEFPSYYALGPVAIGVRTVDVGVPVGYWRSVAASQNIFAFESFLDELAHAAGMDPILWRRHLLADSARERRVLDAVAERVGWGSHAAAGHARGFALVRANGSVVALIVELSVEGANVIYLHRVTAVMDCGIIVNPDSVRAQIEGSVGFALSAAMYGEITLENGAVVQSNFNGYRLIRMNEMPSIDIQLLDSEEPPGGVGEEAVSPLAPAMANALFAATGRRIRDLPFSRAGFTLSRAPVSP